MATVEKKIAYAFNTFFLNFIADLKENDATIKEEIRTVYKVFDKFSLEHVLHFNREADACRDDSNGAIKPFVKCDQTLDDIIARVGEDDVDTVKSYVVIFRILGHMYADSDKHTTETLNMILKRIHQIRNRDENITYDEILDEALASLLKDLDGVVAAASTVRIDLNDIASAKGPSVPEDAFHLFENSMIGNLAKEISEEINIKDLNVSDPSELLNLENLTNSNNVLGQIVSKVSTKIQSRINSGNLCQSDLVSEAMNLMGMMQQSSTPGSDVFKNLMAAMTAKSNGDPFATGNPSSRSSSSSSSSSSSGRSKAKTTKTKTTSSVRPAKK
jgi:hypothetical protein